MGSVAELVKALDLSPNGVTYREFESRRYHWFFFHSILVFMLQIPLQTPLHIP